MEQLIASWKIGTLLRKQTVIFINEAFFIKILARFLKMVYYEQYVRATSMLVTDVGDEMC